jgi:nucleotide-binding universal stress UspA family protein
MKRPDPGLQETSPRPPPAAEYPGGEKYCLPCAWPFRFAEIFSILSWERRGTMFNHILVPLDGSSLAECVLNRTIALAKAFGASVTFLRVLEEQQAGCPQPIDPLEWDMCRAEARSYLEELAARSRQDEVQADYTLLEGHPAKRIMEHIQSRKVDLTVLSSHGRSGLNGWNAGSVISKVILRSRISSLIIRAYLADAKNGDPFRRLMIPMDCSQRAECVLAPAAAIARFHHSEILLVHVVRRPEMPCRTPPTEDDITLSERFIERNQREAKKYFEQLLPRLPTGTQIRLYVDDNAPLRLHDLAKEEKIDLLILSAHGYSGSARWPYGSIAGSFILYGSVPVLIVQDLRPDELEFSESEISAKQSKGH